MANDAAQYQRALVESLKRKEVLHTRQVEDAFLSIPRHLFLPDKPLEEVYSDIAIAVKRTEEGQWTSSSSQPAMMAIMLEQLDLRPGMRVLEIGAGSGFNAALMAHIVGPEGAVTTLDIQPDLIEQARRALDSVGMQRVQAISADGGYGWLQNAPYDRIILTVGAEVIAPAWREQLAPGGKLVMPLGIRSGGPQKSIAFQLRGDELVSISMSDCGFMMLQGAFTHQKPVVTQFGPRDGLVMISPRALPASATQLYDWLRQPNDLPSGVHAGIGELLTGFLTWLSLHRPTWAQLNAEDQAAEDLAVPALYTFGGEWKALTTYVLVEEGGMAALVRPPGEPPAALDHSGPARAPNFEVFVRQLGPSDAPARKLLHTLQAWQAAGKPNTGRLRMRALPAGKQYHPNPGEFLVEKPYHNLVVWYT